MQHLQTTVHVHDECFQELGILHSVHLAIYDSSLLYYRGGPIYLSREGGGARVRLPEYTL
jgi:hypothetical protein